MDYRVPSVDAGMKILHLLSRYKHRNSTLAHITQELGISKATVFRILKTFQSWQVVRYDDKTKTYSLGIQMVLLGERAKEFLDYLTVARTFLRRAAEDTGFTCVLVQRVKPDTLAYVAKEEAPGNFRVTVSLGRRFPITSAAFGKCFLSHIPWEEVEDLVHRYGIERFTERTVTDLASLRGQLDQFRAQGYAVSYGEHTPGFHSVAAPVFVGKGTIAFVLAVIGNSVALPDDVMKEVGRRLRAISADLSEALDKLGVPVSLFAVSEDEGAGSQPRRSEQSVEVRE
ncbi:IclR family transcriptional regulator [Kyrpidia sp.]|uniref:IclR family transcriptional regulator n=1 Tax=Kyrpidia sp. TaxID=2073077 RepID=UPI00258C5E5F|nr:IclR family transcriptional regulator [Kyrpidia sp.]MCL6574825.1 IclR family transcriptional regulator [Kyrpidia sp.]